MPFWKRWTRDPPPTIPDSATVCLMFVEPEKLDELEEIVGWKFKSRALLAQAVTHSSCQWTVNGKIIVQSNEKLEHLGDRALGLALDSYLHVRYPDQNENFYSKVIASALSNVVLAEVGKSLGLDRYLITKSGIGKNSCADIFEAINGALYLDGGLPAVEGFLAKVLYSRVEASIAERQNVLEKV